MRPCTLLVVVAACSFEPRAPGANGDAPPAPDAPPDGAPDVDSDGDGRFDAVDNCVQAPNADQHDEDGDGFGDVCDPCPHVMALQADGDGDGIGDDCDPHPGRPGDRLLRFDPFLVRDPGWTPVIGTDTWTVSDDALHIAKDGGSHALMFDTGDDITQIDFAVTIESAGNASTPHVAGLADLEATAASYYLCSIFPTADAPDNNVPEWALQHFQAPVFDTIATDVNTPPAIGQTYRIRMGVDAGNQLCRLSGTAQQFTSTDALIVSSGVGIRVRDLTVTIPYAAIYRGP